MRAVLIKQFSIFPFCAIYVVTYRISRRWYVLYFTEKILFNLCLPEEMWGCKRKCNSSSEAVMGKSENKHCKTVSSLSTVESFLKLLTLFQIVRIEIEATNRIPLHTHTHIHTQTLTHTHINTYTHMHTHIHIQTHTHNKQTHTLTHIHTHKPIDCLKNEGFIN